MIHPMVAEDYAALRRLWTAAPGMGLRALDDSAEGIGRFLARNPGSCFVAVENGSLVGSVLGGHDGRRGTVYHLCVHPRYRGKGTGGHLVEQALAALRAQGIRKASLVCFKNNVIGNSFWRARGWHLREDLNYYDYVLTDQ